MLLNKLDKTVNLLIDSLRYNFVSKLITLTPKSLMINLTYKCNSHCVMCNIWKMQPKNELKYNEWKKVLKDPIFTGIRNITISGGEVFLLDDYVNLVKLCIDSMPKLKKIVMNTNGFLTDKIIDDTILISNYCNLKKIRLIISISLDGVGNIHNNIRMTEEGFKKTKSTIYKLKHLQKKYNFSVWVGSLLLKQNIKNFNQTDTWLKKANIHHGFQLVGFNDSFVKNSGQEAKIGFLGKERKELFKVLKILKKPRNFYDFNSYYWEDMYRMYKYNHRRTTPCSFLKDDFVIDSLGDVYYCLSVKPIGNFIKEKRTIREIYFDKDNLTHRKNLWNTACQHCNSGCNVANALAYDIKKYLWFKLTKNIFYK